MGRKPRLSNQDGHRTSSHSPLPHRKFSKGSKAMHSEQAGTQHSSSLLGIKLPTLHPLRKAFPLPRVWHQWRAAADSAPPPPNSILQSSDRNLAVLITEDMGSMGFPDGHSLMSSLMDCPLPTRSPLPCALDLVEAAHRWGKVRGGGFVPLVGLPKE